MQPQPHYSEPELLRDILPEGVHSTFSSALAADASLLGTELEMSRKMAEKRYNEFIHGRHCAREVLQQLGYPAAEIGKGESREPLWPDGVVGTISHTQHFAAAAVSMQTHYLGIGVDMESATPLEEKLFKAICRDEELKKFNDDGLNTEMAGKRAKLLFSIKESIYKCLWPSIRHFIDFTEIHVQLNESDGSYSATPYTDKLSKEFLQRLRGRYKQHEGLILTSAWIDARR